MAKAGDIEGIHKEKIPLKLLRLTDAAQDGFVMLDYPGSAAEAELMEEYRGGMNAFVHLSLPDEILVDIEENKIRCTESGVVWYKKDIVSEEHGIRIEKFNSKDTWCDNHQWVDGSDPAGFEQQLNQYKQMKEELLAFYNHYGLLVDFDLKTGYDDYDLIKRQIMYNIKH